MTSPRAGDVVVRPLRESDVDTADRLFRLAFGTFLGLRDPLAFAGDTDYVRVRWWLDPEAAFGAELDGELVGSNFVTNWGSVGFFGPLSVRPDLWNAGVASRLLEPTMECFRKWGTRHAGLFTFAQSPKHVHLYEKFGFTPRFLTAVMTKPVDAKIAARDWSAFSMLAPADKAASRAACRALTEQIFAGLDVGPEIRVIDEHRLGDTVLLWEAADLAGFAVCHRGPGSEAGSGVCYVKFAAIRPNPSADAAFGRLLDACETFAARHDAIRLVAGVNTARRGAYRTMLGRGFRSEILGIAMHRPDEPGYSRPDIYVLDDWR
jgi:GNAT superfamily N-acetyltransferase